MDVEAIKYLIEQGFTPTVIIAMAVFLWRVLCRIENRSTHAHSEIGRRIKGLENQVNDRINILTQEVSAVRGEVGTLQKDIGFIKGVLSKKGTVGEVR